MKRTATAGSVALVLSAPSGAGKTTLARMLVAQLPEARFSVSTTTRAPRGRERDGVDYHFVSSAKFRAMQKRGDFVEWAKVHGNYYGSSRTATRAALARSGTVVFDIDVQGGVQLRRALDRVVLIFILPPSMKELRRRLQARGTDARATVAARLAAAAEEIQAGLRTYDYVVENRSAEEAVEVLKSIVRAEHMRRSRVKLPRGFEALAGSKRGT